MCTTSYLIKSFHSNWEAGIVALEAGEIIRLIYSALLTVPHRIRQRSPDPDNQARSGPLCFAVLYWQFFRSPLFFCYLFIRSVRRQLFYIYLTYIAYFSTSSDAFSLHTPI